MSCIFYVQGTIEVVEKGDFPDLAPSMDPKYGQLHLLDCPCIDTQYTYPAYRYGKYQRSLSQGSGAVWQEMPKEEMPPELLLAELLMG